MRIINSDIIKNTVEKMCVKANCVLPQDVKNAIEKAYNNEKGEMPKSILEQLKENYTIAENEDIPICQDTGMAVFFIEIGKDVFVEGDSIEKAVNDGVSLGYTKGYLRASVVGDPLERVNTKDNTPAVIYCNFTDGDKIKITFAPKGFGSENMSAVKMLKPADGVEGVKRFVVETVKNASSNPCPPIVVGVGIGGTMDKAAVLSKYALTRNLDEENKNEYYKSLENELLEEINKLDIGPAGMGGVTTALGVNIETYPTHIAGLPVAVNISCHVTRHLIEII